MRCRECGSTLVFTSTEYVCTVCGLVEDALSFEEALKISAGSAEQSSPPSDPNITNISGSYLGEPSISTSLSRAKIEPEKLQLFKKLKFIQDKRLRFFKHETEYKVLVILSRVSELLGLPTHIKERAAYFFRKVGKVCRSRVNIPLVAYCLILAVRESRSLLFTVRDIIEAFRRLGHPISKSQILRVGEKCWRIARHLRLSLADYVEIVLRKLLQAGIIKRDSVSALRDKSLEISRKISEYHGVSIQGKNPYALAATIVYTAERELARFENRRPAFTQTSFAVATGIVEHTIRELYRKVLKPAINS